ncbi:MAG TPA: ADP-glyceromanno-heptose 6-epimerase [Bacteroidales bacterium]|nr:ADP-glyceromanno-heptose 6-epimerase [Bacteroidales bacterium]
MIVVTGAAGFIASNMVVKLNEQGHHDLILVDEFSTPEKNRNLQSKSYQQKVHRDDFIQWFSEHGQEVDQLIHLGARTDTTEFNQDIFDRLNLNYSRDIWRLCVRFNIPLIYASSAATYGGGELGYRDDHELVYDLKPLNPYGESKNEFDKWALQQDLEPPFWAGIKFFNVYGPNEYHKGRMASVVYHAFHQISRTGMMKLFRSHRQDYKNGEQLRDFIYVKDVVDVLYSLMRWQPTPGLYNLGTGQARTFNDLVKSVFQAMDRTPDIDYIDTPEDIRERYQYFTEATMDKLRVAGYKKPFSTLEEGIADYVRNYLIPGKYH